MSSVYRCNKISMNSVYPDRFGWIMKAHLWHVSTRLFMITEAQYPLDIVTLECIDYFESFRIVYTHRTRQTRSLFQSVLLGIVFIRNKKAHSSNRRIYFNLYIHT